MAVLARAEYSAPDGVDDRCWRWWGAVKAVGSRHCGVKAVVGAVEAAAVVAAVSVVVVAPASAVAAALASEAVAAAAVVPTP